jgi:DNA gyrase subunit A
MKAEDVVDDVFVCSTHSYLLVSPTSADVLAQSPGDPRRRRLRAGQSGRQSPGGFSPNERATSVVAVRDFSEDEFVVMMATDGLIKKTRLDEFKNIRRGGIIAMNLRPKSALEWARLPDGRRDIVLATRMGKAIRFREKDVRPMGRTAAGVRAMSLAKKDEIIGLVAAADEDKYIFTASEKGYGKRTEIASYRIQRRGGKGLINLKVTPKNGKAVAVLGVARTTFWSSRSRARSSGSKASRSARRAAPPRGSA